jgi:hypothetical protein
MMRLPASGEGPAAVFVEVVDVVVIMLQSFACNHRLSPFVSYSLNTWL